MRERLKDRGIDCIQCPIDVQAAKAFAQPVLLLAGSESESALP